MAAPFYGIHVQLRFTPSMVPERFWLERIMDLSTMAFGTFAGQAAVDLTQMRASLLTILIKQVQKAPTARRF